MKTAGRVDVFASLARASCGTVSAAAVEIPLPGEPAVKAALDPAPFPDRMSAYVWRNWFCVPRSRLASVVGATDADLAAVAVQMGLPAEPAVEREWARKGYITVIRRNWHLPAGSPREASEVPACGGRFSHDLPRRSTGGYLTV